jgi:hypothetical protein
MTTYSATAIEDINKDIDYDYLRSRLKLKSYEIKKGFEDKYPKVKEYLEKKGLSLANLRQHSAKLISTGALTSSLLFSPITQVGVLPTPGDIVDKLKILGDIESVEGLKKLLINNLKELLPEKARPLDRNEEKVLQELFDKVIGIKARANLEGEHLNTTYGYIGAEQHLRRYPGDDLSNHGEGGVLHEGIAPGLGAWGYFAPSKEKLSESLENTEKWYAVVQTLYLPDWNTRQPQLRNWYKYRKVLIVNTNNGNAVVASIADSGPAAWTGKHFGGSPEVMEYLGGPRYKKGPVIIFFVDDPENKVPLGPVDYNKITLPEGSVVQS